MLWVLEAEIHLCDRTHSLPNIGVDVLRRWAPLVRELLALAQQQEQFRSALRVIAMMFCGHEIAPNQDAFCASCYAREALKKAREASTGSGGRQE